MKVAIRYYSRTGSTRQLAHAIQEQLGVAAEAIDIPVPYNVELLFLGTATYAGKMSREVEEFISTLKGRKIQVVAFSSSAFKKSNYQFLHKKLNAIKVPLLPENYHSGSIFHLFRRKRLNEEDIRRVQNFSREIVHKYLK